LLNYYAWQILYAMNMPIERAFSVYSSRGFYITSHHQRWRLEEGP